MIQTFNCTSFLKTNTTVKGTTFTVMMGLVFPRIWFATVKPIVRMIPMKPRTCAVI